MPNELPSGIAAELDSQRVALPVVIFMTVRHPRLSAPVRVVSSPFGGNVGNHVLDGSLYAGIPFKLVEPDADGNAGPGRIDIFNFENQIGYFVEFLKTRPLVKFESYVARDFASALTGDPPARQPLGAPRLLSRFDWLTFVNVQTGTWVSADIVSYGVDPERERASPMLATQDRFPGLFL